MATIAELLVKIGIDDSGLKKGEQSLDSSLKSIGGKVAGLATSFVSLNTIVKGIEFNKMKQNAEIAFTTMLGSADKANRLMKELRDLSVKTPLEFKDVRQAGQTLIQFGVSAKDVTKTVKMLGDVALGDSEKLKSLALAFGQVQSAGKLTGQDLLQMINAGFNPLKVMAEDLSKELGITLEDAMQRLRKEMSEGKVSAEEVAKAFEKATSSGGQFDNAMGNLSDSLAGAQSNFNDALDTFLGMATEGATDDLTRAFKELATILQGLEPQAKRLGDAIGLVVSAGVEIVKFVAGLAKIVDLAPIVGAALGAAFGPWGMLIGAAVGTVASLVNQFKSLGKETDAAKEAANKLGSQYAELARLRVEGEKKVQEEVKKTSQAVEDAYVKGRKDVLSILESEKTEYEKIEDQIKALQALPWASGELENDRLKAIDILRKRQQEAINDQITAEGKLAMERQESERLMAETMEDEAKQFEEMEARKARIAQEYRDEERAERRDDSRDMARERDKNYQDIKDNAEKTKFTWKRAWEDIKNITKDQWKEIAKSITSALSAGMDIFQSYNDMVMAGYEKEIDTLEESLELQLKSIDDGKNAELAALDEATRAKLEAAGVEILTEEEKLQKQIEALREKLATEKDAEDRKRIEEQIAEKENEVKKVAILTEAALERDAIIKRSEDAKAAANLEAEKKIADIRYKADMAAWNAQKLTALANAAQAIIIGFAQLGPIGGAIAAAATAVVTGFQIAAIDAAKPQAPAFAAGTDFAPGGMALVGEYGPEMVNLPQGARVTPAAETRDSMRSGGGGHTFIFNSPKALDAGDASRALRSTVRDLSFEGAL